MRKTTFLVLGVAVLLALPQVGAAEQHRVLPVDQPAVDREISRGPDTMMLQDPNQANGVFSDIGCAICGTGIQIVADNFVVSSGGVGFDLDELFIWGGYYPGDVPVAAPFDIYVYTDAAGAPGAEVCSALAVTPTSDVLTGMVLFGVSEHHIQFNFAPCNLADGTYWVSLFTDTGASADDFFWEAGNLDPANGVLGSAWSPTNPPAPWNLDGATDMAVHITGTLVPVELQSFDIE